MKVFWQQLIGYMLVIFVAVFLFAFRIEDEITSHIVETREEQLLNFGNNVIDNNFSRNDLVRTSQLLESENIIIQVYLSDGRTIYPTYDQRFDSQLSPEELKLIEQGQKLGFRKVDRMSHNGEIKPFLTVYLPHQDVGQFPKGFISLAAPLDDLEAQINAVRNNIMISFGLAIIIGILISIVYTILQTRKISRLQLATKEIALGNYQVVIDTSGQDEFGDLARDFKIMSDSLEESREEIKRQEELRRQLMLDVAHEMRTPLTTISGLVEGFQYGLIPENQKERSIELIQKEASRLTRLVNENLDYEKIRNRQIVLKKQIIEGKALFEQIQTQLMHKAEQKNNTIEIDCSDDVMIWADSDRIVQILINLVNNAIQFSEGSPIILQGRMLKECSEIKVIDHGIGIDQEQLSKIWERFYKTDVSRKSTEFGESGIGLAVVQSLVEAHDGQIEVESTRDKGSTFTIHLPHQNTNNNEKRKQK